MISTTIPMFRIHSDRNPPVLAVALDNLRSRTEILDAGFRAHGEQEIALRVPMVSCDEWPSDALVVTGHVDSNGDSRAPVD